MSTQCGRGKLEEQWQEIEWRGKCVRGGVSHHGAGEVFPGLHSNRFRVPVPGIRESGSLRKRPGQNEGCQEGWDKQQNLNPEDG